LFGYHCFSDDTEVLTDYGWQSFRDVVNRRDGTRLATLNQETGAVEYQVPEKYYAYDYAGEMVHLFGKVDALVTPNHRMWIRRRSTDNFEFVTADALPSEFETRRDLGEYEGVEVDDFVIPAYTNRINQSETTKTRQPITVPMDDWLEFFGYWITEGCLNGSGGVSLYQNPGAVLDAMIGCVSRLGFPMSQYDHKKCVNLHIADVQLARYLKQFGKSRDKRIPRHLLNLSRRQLRILFDALMLGDGHFIDGKPNYFCTASRQLANDMQEIALKLGYCTNLSKHCDGYYYVIVGDTRLTPRTTSKYVERVPYAGKVYCVTVPNGLVFVRRNGKASWQGNSYWMANREDPDALTRHWPYLAGRWEEIDKVLMSAGVRVKWAFTEGGAVGGRVNPDGGFSLYPNDGWKANTCYGGDFTRYLADMRRFNELCAASVAGREGRVLGATLFTSGIGTGWESFQLRGPEMDAMKGL
jgi:hypothetical protein